MSNKLTILFVPMNALGHLNPMIGFAQNLYPKHRIIFAVSQKSKGQLNKFGFEEEVYEVDDPLFNMEKSKMKEFIKETDFFGNKTPIQGWKETAESKYFLSGAKTANPKVEQIVDKVKPDLVVLDCTFILPSLIKNYPWISLITPNINYILFDERSPPLGLGLPANDPSSWREPREELKPILTTIFNKLNHWYESEGIPRNPNFQWCYPSPYLNIYHYPLELDYTDLRPNPPNFVRVDTFMIKPDQEFAIPVELKNKSGKLIYFSLGSVSSMNVELMKRLINYLSSSPHRFIVSKGTFGDKFQLPENFWGDNFVPQTAVLKVVDLVIIHGGNNSLCEAFYYGKPMIVMPLFGDQPDNAQRVHEKGFGIRMNPFTCSKEELLDAIETLLNNKELQNKMKSIAFRCEKEAKSNKIVEFVEQVVSK